MLVSGAQAVPAAAQRHVCAHRHNQPGSPRPAPRPLRLLCLLCFLGRARGEPVMIDGALL